MWVFDERKILTEEAVIAINKTKAADCALKESPIKESPISPDKRAATIVTKAKLQKEIRPREKCNFSSPFLKAAKAKNTKAVVRPVINNKILEYEKGAEVNGINKIGIRPKTITSIVWAIPKSVLETGSISASRSES